MDEKPLRSAPFQVRPAQPKDIPALMRLKRMLAQGENALHAVRASEADWLRDGSVPMPASRPLSLKISPA